MTRLHCVLSGRRLALLFVLLSVANAISGAFAEVAHKSVPSDATEPVKVIRPGDRLCVVIADLMGPGADAKATLVVDRQGRIHLPCSVVVLVNDLTPAKAEKAIVDAYAKAKILNRAQVSVRFRDEHPVPPAY